MIQVTCAILIEEHRILAVRRSMSMNRPGKWEFPGGKIESGETAEQCLIRELQEELAIRVEVIQPLTPTQFNYPDISIQLLPFFVKRVSGEIQLCEHDTFKWVSQTELNQLDWAEADIPIVEEIYSKIDFAS
ncbi:MAG TPA: 8-oxo-dGTP diphosphatase MutT [Flavobacteriales bacterium]|nr:8-oxo-dGTP diphosphatase MutT [Flavobacteriales bacterium]HPH83669.1 8-oxo-dGTP diphosphatase MutT [Flavobacteriales bacterium]